MPITLSDADLTVMLGVAEGAHRLQATQESVGVLLEVLQHAVPCDRIFWNRTRRHPDPARIVEIALPDPPIPVGQEFHTHLHEHPVMSGRLGPVVTLSDVPVDVLKATWMYARAWEPTGIVHEIGVHLTHQPNEIHLLVMSRRDGPDFDERDRLVLRLLRPHLDAAFRTLAGMLAHLTPREIEVMRLVREGRTNQQIARRLGVTEATVAKHLEHVYSRTGAQSRVQALGICGPLLD